MSQENVTSPEQGADLHSQEPAQSTTSAASNEAAPAESKNPSSDEANGDAQGAAAPAAASESSESAPQAAAHDDEPESDNIGNRKRADDVPDDIGNRPGANAAAPAHGEPGTGKKRRRRRKKGHKPEGEGAAAAGGEHAEAHEGQEGHEGEEGEHEGHEGEEGEHEGHAEGEGGEGKSKKPRGDKGPPRERPAFGVGEEVFGRVCKVTEHAVWVDIAGKAVGLFDRRELQHTDAPVEEGDQFIATVASSGVRGGMLMLSQTMPELDKLRERLEAAQKSGEHVEGFVTGAVKGGLEVDLGGLRAFAPASHVDLRHGADLQKLIGKRLEFVVTQYGKRGRDVVLSRKTMLDRKSTRLNSSH